MRQLPEGPLRQHVILNSSRLNIWIALKTDIESVRRAQAAAMSGTAPMDVGSFVQGRGGGKKGKSSKGYGSAGPSSSSSPLHVCGGNWLLGSGLLAT